MKRRLTKRTQERERVNKKARERKENNEGRKVGERKG